MAATGQAAHRVNKVGKDETGLGRWVWIELVGRENYTTRIYTAYRPGQKPPKESKMTTVYHQHAQYIRDLKMEKQDPRDMFDNDIMEELEEQLKTKNIIFMLDANQDIILGHFQKRMNEIGLKNAFLTRSHGEMPSTHHRGSRPISAIFHSNDLKVVRTGILPIGLGVDGDHKNMFVDFDMASVLGNEMYMVADNNMKTLNLSDSRIYKKFNKVLKQHMQNNNILARAQQLSAIATYPVDEKVREKMEELDDQIGRGIKSALKQCRKIKKGKIPFSALFQSLQQQRRLWIMTYKKKIGQRVSSRLIRRLSVATGYYNPLTYTMEEVLYKRKECDKAYSNLIPHASNERRRFLEELAAANAAELNIAKEKLIKRIMKSEQIREQHAVTRRHFPKSKGPGRKVDKVECRKENEWVEISKPNALINELQKENQNKYNCTNHTPLMNRIIHAKFGNFAEKQYAKDFQLGKEEVPKDLPPMTKEMLLKTKLDSRIPRIPIVITEEEVKNTWRITKEKKASSPSGRYNAVYKSKTMDSTLLKILTLSMNLPFVTGQPYRRWSTFLDIMAFKKSDSIKIDTLRSIIISEADWNAAGRIFITRKMMQQAERKNLLPEEHLGGRKGKKSIDGAITKQLYMDNTRIMKIPTVILSADAANCYDRMVHKYISLMCIKWGIEPQVIKALLEPLQVARHYTRTAYGDSTQFFTGLNLQGAGQGNTGAAPYWTCVSTSMIELMKEKGFRAKLISPITKRNILLTLIAFVDDTELFLTVDSQDIQELIQTAQRALETWKQVLLAIGGAMRSKKCAWMLMAYIIKNKKSIFAEEKHVQGNLSLLDDDGEVRNIEKYTHKDPREYLGVVQTAETGDQHQLEVIYESVDKWIGTLNKSKLPPAFNLQAMMTRIHKKILYPLPATNLSQKELEKVSNHLYSSSLSKCGIICTYPLRFRTIPTYKFGLGLPDLYLEMHIGKLKEFLKHAQTHSVLGEQLQYGLETMQIQAGVPEIIFSYNYNKFSHLLEASWLRHMWKFLYDEKLEIKGWPHKLQIQREYDEFIMPAFVKYGIPTSELLILNKCRSYLQVMSVSDIANGDGKTIAKNFMDGKKDDTRRSTLKWTNVVRPGYNAWKLWAETIRTVFCKSDRGTKLEQPLGQWIHEDYHEWEWYHDPSSNALYHVLERHSLQYNVTKSRRTSERSDKTWYTVKTVIKQPIDTTIMHRATVHKESTGVRLVSFHGAIGRKSEEVQEIEQYQKTNFCNVVEASDIHLPPIHMDNFSTIDTKALSHIMKDTVRIVADGSYKMNKSAYCTILESKDMTQIIVITGAVSENRDESQRNTDPYRSEAMGLYVGLLVLKILEEHTGESTNVILSSDNDSALENVGLYSRSSLKQQHFDIIQASHNVRRSIQSDIKIEHVLGHADVKKRNRKATRLEQLNQTCDTLAKYTREKAPPIGSIHLYGENLTLWKNRNKVYHDFDETLREQYYENKSSTILCEKFNWNTQQYKMVDWTANRRAMQSLTSHSTIWISKYVTGFLPIGKNMERRNEWSQDYCPRCKVCQETREHIVRCNEVSSVEIFKDNLTQFEAFLEKIQTPNQMRIKIIMNIASWKNGIHQQHNDDTHLPEPFLAQTRIGAWKHFMEGRLHKQWSKWMQSYYVSIQSRRTGEQWTSQVIQQIWRKFYLAQWFHRNKFVHSTMKGTQSIRKREDLLIRMKEAYESETKEALLVKDQHLLKKTLKEMMQSTDDVIIAWLEEFRLATRDRDENYNKNQSDSIRTLRNWMVSKRRLRNELTHQRYSRTKRRKIEQNANEWSIAGTITELRRGSWKPP